MNQTRRAQERTYGGQARLPQDRFHGVKRLLLSFFLAAGAVSLFWTLRRAEPPELANPPGPASAQNAGPDSAPSLKEPEPPPVTPDPAPVVRVEDQLRGVPPLELQQGELEWEARVRRIRENPALDKRAQVTELLRLLSGGLPEEALESVAEEAVRGLENKDYAKATGLLLNPQTHGRVHAVLFADLVERPDPIRLPGLLAVAKVQGHPFGKVAAEDLELFLGTNHGGNWARWEEAIRLFLAKSGSGM